MAKVLLQNILDSKNISYRQAELRTGVSRSTLADIALGKSDPRLGILEQIAEGLRVRISDLYDSPYK